MLDTCTRCKCDCPDQLLTRLMGAGSRGQLRRGAGELCPRCYEAWLEAENLKAIRLEKHTHTRRGRPPAEPPAPGDPACRNCRESLPRRGGRPLSAGRGLCIRCYFYQRRHGGEPRPTAEDSPARCRLCPCRVHAHGLCGMHYNQEWRAGRLGLAP